MKQLDNTSFEDGPENRILANETYSGWDLSRCALMCNADKGTDQALVKDNGLVSHVNFKDITIAICTNAYVGCNRDCLHKHHSEMANWPPTESEINDTHTTVQLSTCIIECNSEAASDVSYFRDSPSYPHYLHEETATFAMCNRKLSKCCTECQEEFDEQTQEWQEDHIGPGR